MKKNKLILVFALAAVMMMSGCGKDKKNVENVATGAEADAKVSAEEEKTRKEIEALEKKLQKIKVEDYGKVSELKYKGLELDVLSDEVTDEFYKEQIKELIDSAAIMDEVDRAAKLEDTVNIDFVGKVDGKEFEGGSSTGYDLELGSKLFIDDFEEQLVGHKKGDKVLVKVTFPDDYNSEELRGKKAEFDVKINAVKEPTKATELTEEIAKQINPEYTLEQLNTEFRQSVEEDVKKQALDLNSQSALYNALSLSKFEINEKTRDNIIGIYEQLDELQLKLYGTTKEAYLKDMNMSEEDYSNNLRISANYYMKVKMLINAVQKDAKIKITSKEQEEYAKLFDIPSDKLKEYKENPNFDDAVLQYYVMNTILDNAKKNEHPAGDVADIYTKIYSMVETIGE